VNDYAHGALEALAWVLNLLEETNDTARIRRQVEGARDDLLAGVSVNFRPMPSNRVLVASAVRFIILGKRASVHEHERPSVRHFP
jgi:hypothetical protein